MKLLGGNPILTLVILGGAVIIALFIINRYKQNQFTWNPRTPRLDD